MTDTAKGISKLERLLAARRDELKGQRKDSAPESIEEQLVQEALNEEVRARHSRNRAAAAEKPPASVTDRFWRWGAVPIAIVLTVVAFVLSVWWGDGLLGQLKILAVTAGVLGVIGAGVGLWAHNGSNTLDGFGKMLGFSSALVATAAAVVLTLLELTLKVPGAAS